VVLSASGGSTHVVVAVAVGASSIAMADAALANSDAVRTLANTDVPPSHRVVIFVDTHRFTHW
jgi:hypothetical protein